MIKKFIFSIIAIFLTYNSLKATITLPSLITNNMVLQQNKSVTIWGWTTILDETINVNGSWSPDTVSVQAVAGKWKVQIQTPSFGGPYTFCIKGHETKTIQNVMIGEVWLAAGQSNMAYTISMLGKSDLGVDFYNQILANANNPKIRMFNVGKNATTLPQDNCVGNWAVCSTSTVDNFSAVGYFFAKSLYDSLSVPVGIINSSWGGSDAESWVKGDLVTQNERLYNAYKKLVGSGWDTIPPGQKYNGMIYPTDNYNIKGAIWYQGERNKKFASTYTELMTNLISNWRLNRGYEFPFYIVQISPLTDGDGATANLRDAQRQILSVPKTGLVVTGDFSDLTLLHPPQKEEVGRRLALWALAKDYGKDIVCSGPLYKSMSIDGNKINIQFDYAEGGLNTKGLDLNNFEIAGENHFYEHADAVINNNSVIVSNERITNPIAVRFAYSDNAQTHLYNNSGLPASIFRTDTLSYSGPPINNIYISPFGNDTLGSGLETNPFRSILKAYTAAKDGDTIHLASGIYSIKPSSGKYLSVTKSVTLIGRNAGTTIIQGADSSVSVSHRSNGRFATLTTEGKCLSVENLTFRNFGWWGSAENGGVFNMGVIAPKLPCQLIAKHCNFTGNIACTGGAVQIIGSAATAIVEDCCFSENRAMPEISGIAPNETYPDLTVYGGAAINVTRNGSLILRNNVFYKNCTIDNPLELAVGGTSQTGRAVNIGSSKEGAVVIANCTFIQNYPIGATISTLSCAVNQVSSTQPFKFINNLLVNNIAEGSPDGVDFKASASTSLYPSFFNNFKGNVMQKNSIKSGYTLDASNSIDVLNTKSSAAILMYDGNNNPLVLNDFGVNTIVAGGSKVVSKGIEDEDVKPIDMNGTFRDGKIDVGAVQFVGFPTHIKEHLFNNTKISIINKNIEIKSTEPLLISIFNINGSVIFSKSLIAGMIDIPVPSAGIYIAKLSGNNSNEIHKIIVK